ncbi:MAG: CHAD domain-containing protein [Moraxellaceae bacterium]|nr:CHAD domain-containing protein [Moraxellaceae bacterium]
MAKEVELKLAVPPASFKALSRHPIIAQAEKSGPAQTLQNTYYDTPSLDIRNARMAVRTRRIGKQVLQTVKCASSSIGGLSSRPEWEQAFVDGRFDFSAVDDPAARKLLDRHYDDIQPAFDTDFRRETRILTPRRGARIAIMIDSGVIRAGGREAPISEVELELYEGEPLDLLNLALQLCVDLPLYPEDASKAQRGYRLFTDSPLQVARGRPSTLDANQTPVTAFRNAALDCLTTWQANAAGVRESDDPAFVHQLRVSLRRLRSLVRVFAPALPEAFSERWISILGDLAGQVGLARDLDVMHATVLLPVMDAGLGAGSAAFSARLIEERQRAREAGRARMQDAATAQLPLYLMRDLTALPDNDSDTLADFAAHALQKLHKQARRALENAQTLEAEPLHALRIRLKRLRYALECFAPLLPDDRVTRQLKAVSALQEELGTLNDLAVASHRLADWAGEDVALACSRAYILGWHAPRVHAIRSKVLERCARMLSRRPAWRKARKKKA